MSAVTAPLLSNMEHNYATDMVRCLICNTLRTRGAEYSGLVDAVGPECSVDACLSAVLQLPLLSLVDHGAVVCSVCFQLLQEIFSLDLRVRTLRRSVRTNFAETYRGVAQRQQQAGAESGDPAEEVLRRLEEADAEEKLGFLSSGTVNGGCKRCDQGKADAVVSRLKNEHLKEPIIEVQVIQVGRPAKRTRRIQTDSSTLDVSAQGEQSASVAPVAPSDASDPPSAAESPPRAESPPPSEGDSSAPPPAAALPSVSGDEVADDPGDSGSADRLAPAPGRVLRRRPRRRRSPSPVGPLQENGERDNSGIDPITEGHQCEACGTECSDAAELSRHRDVCTPPPLWSCALCGRAFRHLPQLKRHTRQHQLPTRQLSICLKCGVVYPSEAALAEHTASHPPDAADIRICGFCGLGFWSEPELTAHSAAHTVTCTVCHKQLRKDSLREHMRRHTGETPYGCEECGKRFVAFSSLRAHRRTHTGDKPHKCHLCPEMFHLKQSLVEHLERHENKTLRCEVCGREFPSSRRLAAHAKTHDKRRWQPHTCEFCGDGFMTKRSLRAHRARHTGALPFTCDVCGKGFTYEDTYKEHLSVHSGQRPYTCEVCGKSYGRRSCLWAHRNQHTNPGRFSCSHCGKHFTSQSAFNVHMRIHTGERPYRCPSCSASFRLLSSLKRHTETCGSGIPCPPPAAPAPAAPVAAAPIQLQLCMPTGGTAQIEMPVVPPPYSAWPPPLPAPADSGGGGVVTGLSLPDAERL